MPFAKPLAPAFREKARADLCSREVTQAVNCSDLVDRNAALSGKFGAQRNTCPTDAPCYILISSVLIDSREFSSISLINSDQAPRSTRLDE